MLLDSTLFFDSNAPLTVSRQSTNTLDLGQNRDIGAGSQDQHLFVGFPTLPAGPAGAAIQVQYQVSVDNVNWQVLAESPAVPFGSFTGQGSPFKIRIPSGALARYVSLNYIVTGGPLTGGTVTATIADEVDTNIFYPRNYQTM